MHKIVHKKHSNVADTSNTDLVRASDWNDDHSIQWGFAVPNKTVIDASAANEDGDASFSYVELLLPMDGIAGSSSFTDASAKSVSLTSVGGVAHSALTSKFAATCAYFDGVDDAITGTMVNAIGNQDFCIDAWIYLGPANGAHAYVIDMRPSDVAGIALYVEGSTNTLNITVDVTAFSGSTAIPANQWTHVCVERMNGVIYTYVNGCRDMAVGSASDLSNKTFVVGQRWLNTGVRRSLFMQDLRVTAGVSRRTSVVAPSGVFMNAAASDYDPHWDNVVLACHFNGSPASSIMVDEKNRSMSVTNATISSTLSKFNGTSAAFTGSNSYVTTAFINNEVTFGTGDFTIDAWINPTDFAETRAVIGKFSAWPSTVDFMLWIGTDGRIAFGAGNSVPLQIGSNSALTAGQWTHVAVSRSSGVTSMYINGVKQSSTHTGAVSVGNVTTTMYIGSGNASSFPFKGYIQDVRITKGVGRYVNTFIPPAYSFPHGTSYLNQDIQWNNVAALLHMGTRNSNEDAYYNQVSLNMRANSLLDDAGRSVTVNGSPVIEIANSAISPAANAIKLTTGQYLTVAGDMNLPGDFCIEMWFNISSWGTNGCTLFDTRNSSLGDGIWCYVTSAGKISFEMRYSGAIQGTSPTTPASSIVLGTWYHFALTKSGTLFTVWLNGQSIGSDYLGYTFSNTSARFGAQNNSSASTSYDFKGHIDDIRVTKGAARYTANFTRPTQEIPASSPKFGDVRGHQVVPSGEVNISGSAFKFDGTSCYFDGTGDYLSVIDPGTDFSIGTGDFTMEAWAMLTNNGDAFRDILYFPGGTVGMRFGNSGFGYKLQIGDLSSASTCYSCAMTMTNLYNTWHHYAFVRQAGEMKLFVDGVQQSLGSGANPGSYPSMSFVNNKSISGNMIVGGTSSFIGYIQDVRLTKSARYTSSSQQTPIRRFPDMEKIPGSDSWWRGVSAYLRMNDVSDSGPLAHNITLHGDAAINSTDAKFGGASLLLSGDGWLHMSHATAFDFGVTGFTIEAWIKTTTAKNQVIVSGHSSSTTGWNLRMLDDGRLSFMIGDVMLATSAAIMNTGAWTHVAVSKHSQTIRLFIDGVQTATVNSAVAAQATSVYVGSLNGQAAHSMNWIGRIDDLRITNGTGRYTTGFSPNTEAHSTTAAYSKSDMMGTGASILLPMDSAAITQSVVPALVGSHGSMGGTAWEFKTDRPSQWSVWDGCVHLTNRSTDTHIKLNSVQQASEFSIECCFNLDEVSGNPQCIFSKNSYYATAPEDFPLALYVNSSGAITLTLSSGNDYTADTSTSSASGIIQAGAWYHIALRVRNNGTTGVWVNGSPVIIVNISHALSVSSRSWSVGGHPYTTSGGVGTAAAGGKFCGIAYYNRILFREEIYDHYVMSGVRPKNSSDTSYGQGQVFFSTPINMSHRGLPGVVFQAGMNYNSAGPIEISGVDVTIPAGTTWVIQ